MEPDSMVALGITVADRLLPLAGHVLDQLGGRDH
jgi:hypothetical protein